MKSTVAILLIAAGTTTTCARSLRSTEYPEITPFPGNENSKMFCNYACSSKFYGGEIGWGESSPIKYQYPGLVAETKKAIKVFYDTQKNDPVIKACGRPSKDDFQLYNACADVDYDGEDNTEKISSYVLQFGIVVPCAKKTIKKLQSSGVDYPVVNGKFIVPVRAHTFQTSKDSENTVLFAVANPDFAPSSNPYKPQGGVVGFPKVKISDVCDNCKGPTAKQCDKKPSLEEKLCPDKTPGGKYLQFDEGASSAFGWLTCVA